MNTITLTTKEERFFNAYLEAIDFTECGDTDQPEHGAELDADFLRESLIDCLAFYSRIACYISDDDIEKAAHDFWFTRNGHGVGFWDGDWSELQGEMFDRIAKSFGEVYPVFEEIYTEVRVD